MMIKRFTELQVLLLLLAVGLSQQQASAESDPLENANRKIHGFNAALDRRLVKPVAKGYAKVLPGPAKRMVNNFFSNLADVGDGLNNILQGKFGASVSDFGRVAVNSTIGLGGLLDPASEIGLVDHTEDFGQTLATWGVPRGAYIVLPGLGPSSVRDLFGRSVTTRMNPLRYYYPVAHRNSLYAIDLVNTRAGLLAAEGVVFGDEYLFFRDAYLQRRTYLENDGKVEDPFGDDF